MGLEDDDPCGSREFEEVHMNCPPTLYLIPFLIITILDVVTTISVKGYLVVTIVISTTNKYFYYYSCDEETSTPTIGGCTIMISSSASIKTVNAIIFLKERQDFHLTGEKDDCAGVVLFKGRHEFDL